MNIMSFCMKARLSAKTISVMSLQDSPSNLKAQSQKKTYVIRLSTVIDLNKCEN